MTGRSLGVSGYVLAASPKCLERSGAPRSLEDLEQQACLRYLLAGRPRPLEFADGTSIIPDGPFDTDNGDALLQAALEGAGITQFLRIAIEDELTTGRLVIIYRNADVHYTGGRAASLRRQLPLRARVFMDFLVSEIGGLSAN